MKKLQIIIIVFLISFSICTFASMQTKAVTADPNAATHLVVTSSSGVQTAGVPFTITVRALNVYGNTATSYLGTVVFTTSDTGVRVGLPLPFTFTAEDAGVASFSASLVTAGSQSINVTDTVNSSITGSLNVTVVANAATRLVVTSSSGVQTAGVPFSLTVRALNVYGNTATSYLGTVVFTTSDTGVRVGLPLPFTFTAEDAGVASFSASLVTAGSQSINVTDTVNSSITGSLNVTVVANAATRLVVTSSSGVQTAGVRFTITVRALNVYGNTATSYLGTVVFTTSDLGSGVSLPLPFTFTAEDAGVASFSAVLVTAGSQSINVTDTVNSSINGSLAVMVTHASVAVSVTVLPGTATITAGGSQAFTATDKDVYGNTWDVTSTVNWSIDSGAGGSVSAGGLATATKVGTWTVTALDGSGNTGAASLTVTSGAATQLVVSSVASQVAGAPFDVTVTAEDAYGNVATGYTGTVQFASSDGQAVLPADSTLSYGTGTFSITLVTAGSQSITATDTVTSSITGSLAVTVDPNVATQLVVISGASQIAGALFDVTVTAYDAYGNIATGYLGTVTFTSSDLGAGVVLPSAYMFTSGDAGSHVFSVTLVTATTTGWVSATDGVLTGTQSCITVTHAAAVSIAVSPASDTITAGNSVTYSAMATDAYGNTWDDTASVTWSIDSGANGGWSSNVYTSATAGTWTVTATDPDLIYGTASLTVTHASVVSITISPVTQTVSAGASQTYSATAADLFGNTWDVTGSVTWSIDSGAGGSWSGATYTSANAGSWTVKATLGEVYGTASLTVNIYQITVISAHGNPTASASVNEGGSFTASVTSPESAGVGQQWICTGYSIDGGSVVSGTSYTFIDVQSNHTITFNWQEQYYLTTSTNFGSVLPVSGWYDAGSTVTLSATAPSAGLSEQYVWNGWTGTGTGSYSGNDLPAVNEVTMNGPITETASWTHQYQVTASYSTSDSTSPTSNVVLSGTSLGSPSFTTLTTSAQQVWLDAGSSWSVNSPIIAGSGTEQWIATAGTSGTIGSATVVDPSYDHQYYLTVTSAYGTASGAGWYSAGSTAYAGLDTGTVSGGADTQYVFTGWSGDASGSTFSSSNAITMNGPKTATANWETQYQVTFDASSNVKGDSSATIVTVNGIPETATSLPYSMWVDSGSSVSYSFVGLVSGSSASATQYRWGTTSGIDTAQSDILAVTGAGTVTGNYVTQYDLQFAVSGLDSSAQGTVVSVTVGANPAANLIQSQFPYNFGYVDAGTLISYTFTSTVGSSSNGEQFVLTTPAATPASGFSLNGATTVTGTYKTQFEVSFSQTGISSDAGTNTVLTLNGIPYAYSALPTSIWVDAGISFSWSSPVAGSSGEQFVYIEDSGLASPITGSGTDVATYTTQYLVTFIVSPSGSGSTSPAGTNVWENADSLSITATPNTGYTFSSWSSNTESITFNNANSASSTATISGTGTITATFAINTYTITVTQGANGVIAPGTSIVNYGATPSFSVTPDAGYYIASITANGVSVTVTSPSGQTYQFSAVSADGSLTATFAITTSPTPLVSSPSPTPLVSSPSPTPIVTLPSPTPKGSSPSPTPLYVVLVAVIIVAAIILISIGIALKRSRRKMNIALSN